MRLSKCCRMMLTGADCWWSWKVSAASCRCRSWRPATTRASAGPTRTKFCRSCTPWLTVGRDGGERRGVHRDPVCLDVVGVAVAAELVVGDQHLWAYLADDFD